MNHCQTFIVNPRRSELTRQTHVSLGFHLALVSVTTMASWGNDVSVATVVAAKYKPCSWPPAAEEMLRARPTGVASRTLA